LVQGVLGRQEGGRKLDSYACLVALRPEGSKPPLFLVCWEGGRLVGYRQLLKHLPGDVPVYGLRAPAFDGRTLLYSTLEELARVFLEEVRRFRPDPPYLFGGYCFGGTLAHEMARQLEAHGETVAFLGLIESSPYGHGEPRTPRPKWRNRQRAFAGKLAGHPVTAKARLIFARLFGRWSWWRRTLRRFAYRTVSRTGWGWLAHVWHLELIAIRRALPRYVAPTSNAHVTLFEAREPDDDLGPTPWEQLAAGGVDTHPITAPGIDHVSIMHQPHVSQLALSFGAQIDAALGLYADDVVGETSVDEQLWLLTLAGRAASAEPRRRSS
jgi:thioesterase domain-containing protein